MGDRIDPHYSRALDEIYHLRAVLAYEAGVTRAHLGYKTFPKSRRMIAWHQIDRMLMAARGDTMTAYLLVNNPLNALRDAGAPETLTRSAWETT